MKTWIIRTALKILAGITDEQWAQALRFVKDLAQFDYPSEKKRALAIEGLKGLYPKARDFALNLLIEAAVAWFKKISTP